MVSQIVNLASGCSDSNDGVWLLRYMQACTEMCRCGYKTVDYSGRLRELSGMDYAVFNKAVIADAKKIITIGNNVEYINTPSGILELARLIWRGEINNEDAELYCEMDLKQRVMESGWNVSGGILELARMYEAMVALQDEYLDDSDNMVWYKDTLEYSIVGDDVVYIPEYDRGYCLDAEIDYIEFSPCGRVMRFASKFTYTNYIDLEIPDVPYISGSIEQVRKAVLYD